MRKDLWGTERERTEGIRKEGKVVGGRWMGYGKCRSSKGPSCRPLVAAWHRKG